MTILETLSAATDSDIELFQKDGVVCLRNVITPSEIKMLRRDVDEQRTWIGKGHSAYDLEDMAIQLWKNGRVDDVGQSDRFNLMQLDYLLEADPDSRPIRDKVEKEGEGEFFYGSAGWLMQNGVREAALDSALPATITHLLQSKYLNFWEDTTFVKTPQTGQRTPFHQDLGYFQIAGSKCCIVWIPLDPANAQNGTMEYIRGSHLWGKTYAPNPFVSQSPEPLSPHERLPDIEADRENYDIISFDVEPGDVIIHDVLTVHGSGGNLSHDAIRRAVSFRYCGDDITYFDRPGAIPQPYFQGIDMEDGQTLICKDYPLVWPRPHPEAKISDHWPYMSKPSLSNAGPWTIGKEVAEELTPIETH